MKVVCLLAQTVPSRKLGLTRRRKCCLSHRFISSCCVCFGETVMSHIIQTGCCISPFSEHVYWQSAIKSGALVSSSLRFSRNRWEFQHVYMNLIELFVSSRQINISKVLQEQLFSSVKCLSSRLRSSNSQLFLNSSRKVFFRSIRATGKETPILFTSKRGSLYYEFTDKMYRPKWQRSP